MDNNKVIAIELVIVAFLVALTFFIDIPRVDALSVTQSKAEPHYAVINDAPFFITVDKVNATHMTVTLTVKEGNRTLDKTGTLDAKKQLISSAKSMLSSNKVAAKDLKDGYKEQVTFAWKSGDTFKWGYNSSSVTVTESGSILVSNGEYFANLDQGSGTFTIASSVGGADYALETAFAAGWFRTSDDTAADIFSGSTNPAISVKLDLSPVAAVLHTQSTSGGTTESWRDDYFKVGSNWTDSVQLTKSTNNANQGSVYIRPNASELYCAGQSWVGVNTAFNYDLSSYRTLWCAMRNNTATGAFVTWRNTNPIQGTGTGQIGRVGSGGGAYNLLGFMYDGATPRANPSRIDFREGVTNGTDDSLLAETQRIADIKNMTASITDYDGSMIPGWGGANGTLAADMVTCLPSDTGCNAEVENVNGNTTRMYVMGNFSTSTTDLYAYVRADSASIDDSYLCWHIYNASGGWLLDSTASNVCNIAADSDIDVRSISDVYNNGSWASTFNDGSNLVFATWFNMDPGIGDLNIYISNATISAAVPPAAPQWLSYGSSFNCTPWAFFNSTWDALDSCNFESNFTGSLVNVSGTILGTTCYFDSAADNNIAIMWRFIANSTEGRMFSQNSTPWDYLTPSCEAPPSLPNITGNCTSCFKPTHEMTRLNSVCLDADRMMVNYGSIMCANGICNNFTSADVVLCSNGCDSDLGACRPDAAVSVAIFAAILISLAIGAYLVWRWV